MGNNLEVVGSYFEFISFTNVYKDLIIVADALSKEGQTLEEGLLFLSSI
jgi:hypothetical protein